MMEKLCLYKLYDVSASHKFCSLDNACCIEMPGPQPKHLVQFVWIFAERLSFPTCDKAIVLQEKPVRK